MHRILGSSEALKKYFVVPGMTQQNLDMKETGQGGERGGMQQCAAIKGDIYLEMLRKRSLGVRGV